MVLTGDGKPEQIGARFGSGVGKYWDFGLGSWVLVLVLVPAVSHSWELASNGVQLNLCTRIPLGGSRYPSSSFKIVGIG